jgi:hypothetical protein
MDWLTSSVGEGARFISIRCIPPLGPPESRVPHGQTYFFPAELIDASVQAFHGIDQRQLVYLVQAVYPLRGIGASYEYVSFRSHWPPEAPRRTLATAASLSLHERCTRHLGATGRLRTASIR